MLIGPRAVLAGAWLFSDWYDAFASGWVALLGWLLLPWTSLAYIYVHFHNGGEVSGGYLVLLIVSVLVDAGTFGGGRAARRRHAEAD